MSEGELVRVEQSDGVVIARVTGAVDLSNAAEVEATLIAAARTGRGALVVDLTAVSFLDSAGVRCLDHLLAERPSDGSVLVVAEEHGRARFTLRLCGFPDDLLRDDLAAAVSELSAPPAGWGLP
jgi:anti-sigma B factor antagonist